MSRILGVDYGTKRVGLAISDGLGITARPLEVSSRADLTERLRELHAEYGFTKVVVGLPTALSGNESESTKGARDLGREIERALPVTVILVDERFTSRLAEKSLIESGMKRRERKETVDKVAAAIILQTYLDTATREGNSEPADDVEPPVIQ